jgi:RES domain-containing protein
VEVFRLTRRKFAGENPFDGEGSFLFGGRWSNSGTRICYAATHRSLAILEYLAHIDRALIPNDLVIATLEIPEDIVMAPAPDIPRGWGEYPAPASLKKIGDDFIVDGKFAVLMVPSVLVPQENNVLLNPLHLNATRMIRQKRLVPFRYDSSFFNRGSGIPQLFPSKSSGVPTLFAPAFAFSHIWPTSGQLWGTPLSS